MHPVLFKLNIVGSPVEIGSYRFFLVLAAFIGVGSAWLIAKRRGLPGRQALILSLSAAAAVPVGARLLHIATNLSYYGRDPGRVISTQATGFALFGGLGLAVIVGAVLARLLKFDLWRTADSVAPALGLSMAVVRIGCFLDGCCAGTSSSLPWAVTFPSSGASEIVRRAGSLPLLGGVLSDIAATRVSMHPVDIYELFAALAGVALAALLLRQRAADGTAFLAFALWFSAFRLANHPLRVAGATFDGPEWFYPALYVAALLMSAAFLRRRVHPAQARQTSDSIPISWQTLK